MAADRYTIVCVVFVPVISHQNMKEVHQLKPLGTIEGASEDLPRRFQCVICFIMSGPHYPGHCKAFPENYIENHQLD